MTPWQSPGMYAYENPDAYALENMEEADEADEAFRQQAQSLFRGAGLLLAAGTAAYAAQRGNNVPKAAVAGLFWPFYLAYVVVKG